MGGPYVPLLDRETIQEGKTDLFVSPSGGQKGPGTKGGVFFNPAMVQNRDLSLIFLEYLQREDLLVGKNKRVLDGLCGSGARALRIANETSLIENDIGIVGTDINPLSIETALRNSDENDLDIEFNNVDLNSFLSKERFSYIDIDPFGSPVPFIQSAVQGVLNGGTIGITATDTAALSGSIPRVARRRYGIESYMTHAYQEISCRSLLGYVARIAATFERGIEPLLFYTSDHFIRGYLRIRKGARKADASLENVGWFSLDRPGPPVEIFDQMGDDRKFTGKPLGPVWTGPLEDPGLCSGLKDLLDEEGRWDYLSSYSDIRKMLDLSISESGLPMLGYDVNILSSHLKVSPPSMGSISGYLENKERIVSRSRFSPTVFKTDARWDEVIPIFTGRGD